MPPWCSFRAPVVTRGNLSYAKLCPSVPLLLSVVVTSLFVPSGNTSSRQVTRGHFFYSQPITSVPSFLLSLCSSGVACFCSLLSPWNAFSQICPLPPGSPHGGRAICRRTANPCHLSLFLPLQSPFLKPVLIDCVFLLPCLQI